MAFTFNSPVKIVFGEGCAGQVGQELAGLGAKKVLIITGPGHNASGGHEEAFQVVTAALKQAGLDWSRFAGAGQDPTPAMVKEGVRVFKEEQCDAILALGGGSPMDCAKAIGASVGEGRPFADFVGTGRNAGVGNLFVEQFRNLAREGFPVGYVCLNGHVNTPFNVVRH